MLLLMPGGEVVEEKIRVYVRARPVRPEDEECGAPQSSNLPSTFLGGELDCEAAASSCIAEWAPEGTCVYKRPGASSETVRFDFCE